MSAQDQTRSFRRCPPYVSFTSNSDDRTSHEAGVVPQPDVKPAIRWVIAWRDSEDRRIDGSSVPRRQQPAGAGDAPPIDPPASSCGAHAPTAESTLNPARTSKGSLTPYRSHWSNLAEIGGSSAYTRHQWRIDNRHRDASGLWQLLLDALSHR
jgi:hypothetical protein